MKNTTTEQVRKPTKQQQIKALRAEREAATSAGIKAAISRRLRVEYGIQPPTKTKATAMPATPENLKTLENQREKATTAGIKAALTRRIKTMQAELDS